MVYGATRADRRYFGEFRCTDDVVEEKWKWLVENMPEIWERSVLSLPTVDVLSESRSAGAKNAWQ